MEANTDIQSFDAILDAKYGAPGTDRRAKAEEDAFAYYSGVLLKKTSRIKTEKQYKSIMKRIDELFFTTDESTPANDPRLVELDVLSALVEEYEKEEFEAMQETAYVMSQSDLVETIRQGDEDIKKGNYEIVDIEEL